jgi:tetratricopeptide (TPR) repeat protein
MGTRACWLLAALGLSGAGGCANLPEEGLRLLRDANGQYQTAQYDQAVRSTSKFIEQYGNNPAAAEAFYIRGLARLALGQREDARGDFNAVLERSKRQELSARAQAQLGNMAFDDRDYTQAADRLEKSLASLPKQPPSDEIAYRLGVACQRTGRWEKAQQVFAAVLEDYPDRPVNALARRQAAWNHDYFAIQCGAYRQRGNAEEQVQLLGRHGIRAEAVPDTWENQPLFVVHVGRFDDYDQALKELPRVKQVVGDAIIRP